MLYSSWEKFLFGVQPGYILDTYLLFNIFICDLFRIMSETDFANYADDNTPYASRDSMADVNYIRMIAKFCLNGF